jgi:hypothetical protein
MGKGELALKKLVLRLFVLILLVYVAGSIYPLFAHEVGHSHGPAPAPAPAPPPPPAPTPVPSAPSMLDTKGPQLPPPSAVNSGGGGCGGPEVTIRPLMEASSEQSQWRSNVDSLSESRIKSVRSNAAGAMADINRDIKKAQDRWHQADIEVNKYQGMKNRGTLINDELLQMSQEERQEAWQELQRQKDRTQKVEAWADKKVGEIRALTGRAKGGDYNGYRGLRDFDWSYHPSQFK